MSSNIDLIIALDKLRINNLYVHNDILDNGRFVSNRLQGRSIYLVETLAVINALVDNGTMLLYGGHGGGKTTLAKYLGQLLYKFNKDEIEDCILRGHPQLTEEKILGGLDIAQLTKAKELNSKKEVDVIWNSFVDSQWKIIDELNRLSPYAQNILLSLLAEGSVKYHNESKRLPSFSLYATMNPKDEGNFEMSLPFLDRFSLALPITMPGYESLSTIGRQKDKSQKQDGLSTYLQNFDLDDVKEYIKEFIKISTDAELFINIILLSYNLCERISKESNTSLTVERGLCNGCHYDAPEKVCNKVINPLSVRVKEDLYRYSKAYAWFLGADEVSIDHVKQIAPYMLWHRSALSKKFKNKLKEDRFNTGKFSMNLELEATIEIIQKIYLEFEGLLPSLQKFEDVKKGKLNLPEFNKFQSELQDGRYGALIIQNQIIPSMIDYSNVYSEIEDINKEIDECTDLNNLDKLKERLSTRYDIPNRQFLTDRIERAKRNLAKEQYDLSKYVVLLNEFDATVKDDCIILYDLIRSKYPAGLNNLRNHSKETLSDFGDNSYSLKIKKIVFKDKPAKLRFEFQGDTGHSIAKYLEANNAKK